ncbi:tRNA A-37 threonylcarbamoyl transferase component Bud32 [Roseinatronobacter thiooxidans]|uniref:tRNA A-37 threonylcarbamoyl transferase component Bud32 n=1 Tax=Roseinatronobacter thiooxidans TaxID=121821 RepID=A0A2W7QUI6_9RHOB|nr:lipopolysaccharide kinase InaA family protein [Roseinatronobacter thiooxidans]PZX47357.1 tRNA A-37 threonylcarbamoyl transferase component Bud32 [Roseinatronobacter thiooxidans]
MQDTNLPPPSARRLLDVAHAKANHRLYGFELDGKKYFVKRLEQHRTRRARLMKGDPARALAREIALLEAFSQRGAPVPQIVAQDDTCFIMTDCGPPIHRTAVTSNAPEVIWRAVGTALANLHALGLVHGRPAMRDICWDGQKITFLDLEAGAKLKASQQDMTRDVIVLLHSILREGNQHPQAATFFQDAYRQNDTLGVWDACLIRARRLWWVEWVIAPVVLWHRWNGVARSEFAAVRPTRQFLLSQNQQE